MIVPTTTDTAAAALPLPALALQVRDLNHPGSKRFLGAVNTSESAALAHKNISRLLYPGASATPPPTRAVTFVLRDMPGVAYTVGVGSGGTDKEIHVALPFVAGIAAGRLAAELDGVITHEMVHCFQHNARGSAPGGLVEGVADWVRLSCGLAPPHWKKEIRTRWDDGYQHTAYFLDFLERKYGAGTVRRVNEALRVNKYDEKTFWNGLFRTDVNRLYKEYTNTLPK